MDKTKPNEFMDFLRSGLSEMEYYKISNFDEKSLITLRAYLEEINKLKIEYLNRINDPLSEIIKKNKWVNNIGNFDSKLLYVYSDTHPSFTLEKNDLSGNYKFKTNLSIYATGEFISIEDLKNILVKIKLHYRKKIESNSRLELREIGRIVEEMFKDYKTAESATGKFSILNYYNNVSELIEPIYADGHLFADLRHAWIYRENDLEVKEAYKLCSDSKERIPGFNEVKENMLDKIYIKR